MVESKSSKPEANKENADPEKEMAVDEEEEEDETAPSKVFTIESELPSSFFVVFSFWLTGVVTFQFCG